jgi:uncharacterized surface protein with fasciclin (FAS1) repeats
MKQSLMRCITAVAMLLMLTAGTALAQDMNDQPDIVETAINADGFNTLATALQEAELVSTLQGEGPFTVFAPTDEAFAALPEGTLESLLQPENRDQLVNILTYHVVPGKVMASDVTQLEEANTVAGPAISIQISDGNVMLMGDNTAQVVQTDIEASNGVIHVIDTVLMPPSDEGM